MHHNLIINLRPRQIDQLYKKRKLWVCRNIDKKQTNILIQEYDQTEAHSKRLEALKKKLDKIQALIDKQSAKKFDIKRRRPYLRKCGICGKKVRGIKNHVNLAHNGKQSNLPRLKLKVVQSA